MIPSKTIQGGHDFQKAACAWPTSLLTQQARPLETRDSIRSPQTADRSCESSRRDKGSKHHQPGDFTVGLRLDSNSS